MRIVVLGDMLSKEPVLLSTSKATSLLIETDDGRPNVIFKMLPDNKGWLRLTQGEDKNFNETAKQLGFI